jgi:plastocyanin
VFGFPKHWRIAAAGVVLGACLNLCAFAQAQLNTVTAHMDIKRKSGDKTQKAASPAHNSSEVVVWLKPLDHPAADPAASGPAHGKLQLVQKDKSFHPHLLVVPVGSTVDFPNHDPFFHNVFSLFDGKRFDLGLYEAGATNSVRFDRVGVSFLFCNIHPEMSAVVVAVDTPYYAISDRAGNIAIADVPDGRYELHVWYERSLPEDLKALTRTVNISAASKELGSIGVPENVSFSPAHKNKYGQDYTTPPAPSYAKP